MLGKLLFNPFLLRRFLKLQERQTIALETIARYASINTGGAGATIEQIQSEGEGEEYSVSSDFDTYIREQQDRHRHFLAEEE